MGKRKMRGLEDLMIDNGLMFDAVISFVDTDKLQEAAKCSFRNSPMANDKKGIFKDLLKDTTSIDEVDDLFKKIQM